MITLEQIQAKIAEAIRLCGLTQTEISKRLGISQPSIAHYIKGDKMPALDTFANLCAVLDLDPAEILCLTDYGKTSANVQHNDFRHNNGTIVNTFKQK